VRGAIAVPDVARHADERSSVPRSALRILSLVTLVAAVAATVILTQEPAPAEPASALSAPTSFGAAQGIPASAVLAQTAQRHVAAQAAAVQQRRAAVAAARRAAEERRRALAVAKAAAERRERAAALARASRAAQRNPKAVARLLVAQQGWSSSQFSCLESLWERESGWNYKARNPSSGAFGIPQALPGPKMAKAGSDWRTNPVTQIRWGLDYIADRYGTPCGAWGHSESAGWY
jgi:murein DD-endopeptidase MepM/ murein hydrolase activator NlpD